MVLYKGKKRINATLTLYLPIDMVQRVTTIAASRNVSAQAIYREAIGQYLERVKPASDLPDAPLSEGSE